MSDRIEQFSIDGTPHLVVRVPVGDVRVVPGATGTVVVRLRGSERNIAQYLVESQGATVTVEPDRAKRGGSGSVRVVIEVGDAPVLEARTASSDLAVEVALAELSVDTAAGDVRAGDVAGGVRVKTASGDLRLGSVGGRLSVATAAGDLLASSVGRSADVKTASGDVHLDRVGGDVTVKSAAGDVRIDAFEGDDLNVKTLSGDVSVGVGAGRRYRVSFNSLSGDIRTDFPVSEERDGGAPARLTIQSMSGDISIEPARA